MTTDVEKRIYSSPLLRFTFLTSVGTQTSVQSFMHIHVKYLVKEYNLHDEVDYLNFKPFTAKSNTITTWPNTRVHNDKRQTRC